MSTPLKWQKYLLLLRFGLVDAEEIYGNIRRHAWTARETFLDELSAELHAGRDAGAFLYVLKLVPNNGVGQLPNLRIAIGHDSTREDVARSMELAREFVSGRNRRRPDEVWWCRTDMADGRTSVAGRVAFQTQWKALGQIIEHVSRASPRLIEMLRRGQNDVFYVRARRVSWGYRWIEEEAMCPPATALHSELEQFRITCREIERSRERIETFCERIEELGMTSYSLEYKMVGSRLSIIDWDTGDDRAVLEKLT